MILPKEWPHYVKNGNTSIPIYFSKTSRGYDEFKVVWRDAEQKRRFKTFADFDDARKHAGNINAAISAGDIRATVLKGSDHHAYVDAVDALKGLPVQLNIAVRHYADAVKRLGSVPLSEAVAFYLKHNGGVTSKTVTEVFNEFIASKRTPSKNKKAASKKHLDDLESRLGKFSDSFKCKIGDVKPADVLAFLDGLGEVSGRTWFNYARQIRSLFNYAQAKRYLASGIDPMEGIDIEYEDDSEIEIFTPEELKKLFASARPELVPFLAIAAFAGVRHAEIARLDWSHISKTHIEVKAKGAKTRARRVIEIQPNLAKWLAPYWQQFGPVAPFANMSKQLLWLADDAGVEWKHNALRHSFISYRLAQTHNENMTAVEAGNSPTMIQHHYRQIKDHTGRVITSELAKAWFSIQPETSAKIVPMLSVGG